MLVPAPAMAVPAAIIPVPLRPAPPAIALAPAVPAYVARPMPLYRPYAMQPLTWGAACRSGDQSACIMAQAEGPNRGP